MFIKVLASGSSGNGYIIGNDDKQIVIECGVPIIEVEKALDFDLSKVVGCIVSHEHQDHVGRGSEYVRRLPVYATEGTLRAAKLWEHQNAKQLHYQKLQKIGDFSVLPFKTEHDAEEPCGFIIKLPDGSKLLFATDTYYVHYKFKDVAHWLVECNYDGKILSKNIKNGLVHPKVADRVRKSHMSLSQCIETLQANDLSKTKEIILIHLSSQNSIKQDFVKEVCKATGKYVTVAEKGLNIELL